MGNACCSVRDRNDKISGIEQRNNMFFYFNYPLFIENTKSRLASIESMERAELPMSEIAYMKWTLQ